MVWAFILNEKVKPSKTSLEDGDQSKETEKKTSQEKMENLTNDIMKKCLRDYNAQGRNLWMPKIRIPQPGNNAGHGDGN